MKWPQTATQFILGPYGMVAVRGTDMQYWPEPPAQAAALQSWLKGGAQWWLDPDDMAIRYDAWPQIDQRDIAALIKRRWQQQAAHLPLIGWHKLGADICSYAAQLDAHIKAWQSWLAGNGVQPNKMRLLPVGLAENFADTHGWLILCMQQADKNWRILALREGRLLLSRRLPEKMSAPDWQPLINFLPRLGWQVSDTIQFIGCPSAAAAGIGPKLPSQIKWAVHDAPEWAHTHQLLTKLQHVNVRTGQIDDPQTPHRRSWEYPAAIAAALATLILSGWLGLSAAMQPTAHSVAEPEYTISTAPALSPSALKKLQGADQSQVHSAWAELMLQKNNINWKSLELQKRQNKSVITLTWEGDIAPQLTLPSHWQLQSTTANSVIYHVTR